MPRFIKSVSMLLVFALFVSGASMAEFENKKSIVCTSFPCYDFVRAVAGEEAEITLLIKPGTEVHSFEPTPADVLQLAECDLFVYIGGESDAWAVDLLESFGNDAPETLRLFDCVEAIEADDHDHDHDAHEYDEHIWTSPKNAIAMIDAVAMSISEIDPARMDTYRVNAASYQREIALLDAEIRSVVENAQRHEMIFADRFPFLYFTKEYGLDYVAAFSSCSSESEPSAKTIAMLINRVSAEKIPVIYILELSSGKTAQVIAAETGAKIRTFYSMQNISEADFSAGESYLSLMQRNIEALREGLN